MTNNNEESTKIEDDDVKSNQERENKTDTEVKDGNVSDTNNQDDEVKDTTSTTTTTTTEHKEEDEEVKGDGESTNNASSASTTSSTSSPVISKKVNNNKKESKKMEKEEKERLKREEKEKMEREKEKQKKEAKEKIEKEKEEKERLKREEKEKIEKEKEEKERLKREEKEKIELEKKEKKEQKEQQKMMEDEQKDHSTFRSRIFNKTSKATVSKDDITSSPSTSTTNLESLKDKDTGSTKQDGHSTTADPLSTLTPSISNLSINTSPSRDDLSDTSSVASNNRDSTSIVAKDRDTNSSEMVDTNSNEDHDSNASGSATPLTSTSPVPTSPAPKDNNDHVITSNSTVSGPGGKTREVVIKVTRAFTPILHQNVMEEEGENKMRNKVINEIINTEKDYISDLKVIINVLYNPLRESKILPEKDIAIIFSNVQLLLNVNEVLLLDLEKAAKEKLGASIGPCFKYLADYLKIYSSYCSNQQLSHDHLVVCMKKYPAFKQFLDERQSLPECRQCHLDSFLIKPIQRLCKYPLLLRELIKNSDEKHPDNPSTEEAYSKIQTVVVLVNENKRKAEVQQKMYKIHELLESTEKFDFLTPTRYLIREDTLKELNEDRTQVACKMHYYLFNDIIMRTKKEKKSIKLETLFVIASMTINGEESRTAQFCNTFEMSQLGSAGRKFTIVCDSYEQKMEWMTDIETLLKPYQEESMREYEKMLDETMADAKTQKRSTIATGNPSAQPQDNSNPALHRSITAHSALNTSSRTLLSLQASKPLPPPPPKAKELNRPVSPIPPPTNNTPSQTVTATTTTPPPTPTVQEPTPVVEKVPEAPTPAVVVTATPTEPIKQPIVAKAKPPVGIRKTAPPTNSQNNNTNNGTTNVQTATPSTTVSKPMAKPIVKPRPLSQTPTTQPTEQQTTPTTQPTPTTTPTPNVTASKPPASAAPGAEPNKGRPLPSPSQFTAKLPPRQQNSAPNLGNLVKPVATATPKPVEATQDNDKDDEDDLPPVKPLMAFPKGAAALKKAAPSVSKSYSTFTPSTSVDSSLSHTPNRAHDDLSGFKRPPVLPPTSATTTPAATPTNTSSPSRTMPLPPSRSNTYSTLPTPTTTPTTTAPPPTTTPPNPIPPTSNRLSTPIPKK